MVYILCLILGLVVVVFFGLVVYVVFLICDVVIFEIFVIEGVSFDMILEDVFNLLVENGYVVGLVIIYEDWGFGLFNFEWGLYGGF